MNGPDMPDTLPFDKGARLKTIRHLGRLFAQIWRTSPLMMSLSIVLRILVAVLPPLLLLITKFVLDEVSHQASLPSPGPDLADWWESGRLNLLALLLGAEFLLVFGLVALTAPWLAIIAGVAGLVTKVNLEVVRTVPPEGETPEPPKDEEVPPGGA